MRWIGVALPVALLLTESLAAAAAPSPLWDDVAHPDRPLCDALVAQAKTRRATDAKAGADLLGLAEKAARRCPDHVAAQALAGHLRLEVAHDYAAALAPLVRARVLEDADGRLSDPVLAFDLGLAHAVVGDLDGSLDEYRRAEAAGGVPGQRALLQYDLGDTLLALGRVHEAIDAYRRAVKLEPRIAIHHWALAVALDRDGQLTPARSEMDAVLAIDHDLVALAEQYFFVPRADQWYYLALGYRALGKLELARKAIGSFLRELPSSPYAARARELQAGLAR